MKVATQKIIGPFAPAIRELRRLLGESQDGMAKLLGLTTRAYQFWESGETTPRGSSLLKLRDLAVQRGMEKIELAMLFREEGERLRRQTGGIPDPYEALFTDLRAIIDSGQSELIGEVEECLCRIADLARHMSQKKKRS